MSLDVSVPHGMCIYLAEQYQLARLRWVCSPWRRNLASRCGSEDVSGQEQRDEVPLGRTGTARDLQLRL